MQQIPKKPTNKPNLDKQEPPENRRKLLRFFISPKLQLRYGTYFSAVALSVVAIWGGLAGYFMMNVMKFDPKLARTMTLTEYVNANIKSHQWIFIAAFCVSGILFLALSMVLTERIGGPMRALLKHIEALDRGDFTFKTKLRKSDELKPLMHALNSLSDSLRDRQERAEPVQQLPRSGTD